MTVKDYVVQTIKEFFKEMDGYFAFAEIKDDNKISKYTIDESADLVQESIYKLERDKNPILKIPAQELKAGFANREGETLNFESEEGINSFQYLEENHPVITSILFSCETGRFYGDTNTEEYPKDDHGGIVS